MEIKRSKTPDEALRSLMSLCAKSEKSTGDAFRTLARWGVDPGARQAIVERLVDEKFIDNRRYAAAYVREKIDLSRWGVHKIRAGLRAKQIPEAVIAEALEQADSDTMRDKLRELLFRKMRSVRARDNYELRGKLLRYGASLGFDFDEVGDAIDRLMGESR